ncbi:MAG TPA: signal peptidase II [bacterium]|jgi:lipoprotein signal peptidase|nr:signal peptidase II [bacterium]
MSKYNCSYVLSGILNPQQFSLLSLFVLILFSFIFLKYVKKTRIGHLGLLIMIFGSLFNIYERYTTGCIKDYISFFNLFYFNIRDAAITLGIMLISISIWKEK